MEHIESTKNEYIKLLRKLNSSRAARREHALFIAEGEKCAQEALQYGFARSLLISDEKRMAALAADAETSGVRVICVSRTVMEAVCDSKTPQDAAAVCAVPQSTALPKHGLVVVLEDLSDPQNVGAVIRTADAVAADAVLLSAGCADPFSPRAVRASMGSIFHTSVITCEDLLSAITSLKEYGFCITAGHLHGGSEFPHTHSCAVLIGNESRGLSESASALADVLYKIPIYGKAESLNAAVAAGIMLYECKKGQLL